MSKKITTSALTAAALTLGTSQAGATTVLSEKDTVQAFFSGFAQFDIIGDSTRSLGETAGNNPIDKKGTYKGDNGRLQFTARNSRLGFGLLGKGAGSWKSKGYVEFDFLGYQPSPGEASVTETSFYQNAVPRLRHAYAQSEGDGWSLLAGQSSTLFGWYNETLMSTIGYAPIVGELNQRSPQLTAVKTVGNPEDTNFQFGLSLARPVQRESAAPNVDAGLRLRVGEWRGAYVSTSGEVKASPMSIGVSGTLREISAPKLNASGNYDNHKQNTVTASALAVDVLIPIIGVTKGGDVGNSLALTGEFTKGTGYADHLSGWSGNLAPVANASTVNATTGAGPNQPNLDPGIAGYKAGDTKLTLVHLQTWNSTLQYHLPSGLNTFITGGFSELWSDNAADLAAASGKVVYTRAQSAFGNVIHDFSKEIRGGVEYVWDKTRYKDNSHAQNNRFQLTTWYRF